MKSGIDFAYPWWLSYGHLVVAAVVLPLLLLGRARRWPIVPMLLLAAVTLWSLAAFVVAFTLDVNGRLKLPTQNFIASGAGHVLDMGAGTGRSTLMVLEGRPRTTVVALDLFSESYREHFGEISGQQKLLDNLKAAGLENRATIQTGDMRSLPFAPATFDDVVSTFAIDHLNKAGIDTSLREAWRVMKPGGDFLLMVISKDGWLKFTFGPLLLHSGTRGQDWWAKHLQQAGFQIKDQGARPATLYFVGLKP